MTTSFFRTGHDLPAGEDEEALQFFKVKIEVGGARTTQLAPEITATGRESTGRGEVGEIALAVQRAGGGFTTHAPAASTAATGCFPGEYHCF